MSGGQRRACVVPTSNMPDLILRSRVAASRRMNGTSRATWFETALRAPHHEGLAAISDWIIDAQHDRRNRLRHHGQWAAAFSKLDAKALASLYSKNAFFFGSNPNFYRGNDGVQAYFEGLPRWQSPSVQFTDVRTAQAAADVINVAGTASFFVEEGCRATGRENHLGDRSRRRRVEDRQPPRVVEDAADRAVGARGGIGPSSPGKCRAWILRAGHPPTPSAHMALAVRPVALPGPSAGRHAQFPGADSTPRGRTSPR